MIQYQFSYFQVSSISFSQFQLLSSLFYQFQLVLVFFKHSNISFSLTCETLYRLVGYESVKGLPSETNFFISDYKSIEKKCAYRKIQRSSKEHLFICFQDIWYYLRFCVDKLFWLIVSFRIVMGNNDVNRLVIVIASE